MTFCEKMKTAATIEAVMNAFAYNCGQSSVRDGFIAKLLVNVNGELFKDLFLSRKLA